MNSRYFMAASLILALLASSCAADGGTRQSIQRRAIECRDGRIVSGRVTNLFVVVWAWRDQPLVSQAPVRCPGLTIATPPDFDPQINNFIEMGKKQGVVYTFALKIDGTVGWDAELNAPKVTATKIHSIDLVIRRPL